MAENHYYNFICVKHEPRIILVRICRYQSNREGGEDSIHHWCPPDMIPFGWGHFKTSGIRGLENTGMENDGEKKSIIKSANQVVNNNINTIKFNLALHLEMQKVHPLNSMESDLPERDRMNENEDVKSEIVKVERHSPVSIELRNAENQDDTKSEKREDSQSELELVVTLCESPHR